MKSSARGLAVIAFTIAVTSAAQAAPGHSATASASAHAAGGPPVATRTPVVDDYYGTKVTDDYRWMEDRRAPAFEQWCRGQSRYARSVLDAIPGRDSSTSARARTAPRTCSSIPIAMPRPDIISRSTTTSLRRMARASSMESRPEAPRRASSTSSMSPRGTSRPRPSIVPTTAAPRGAPTIAPFTTTASRKSAPTARTPTST